MDRRTPGSEKIRSLEQHFLQTSGSRLEATHAASWGARGCDICGGGGAGGVPCQRCCDWQTLLDVMPSGVGESVWAVAGHAGAPLHCHQGRAPAAHPAAPGTLTHIVAAQLC